MPINAPPPPLSYRFPCQHFLRHLRWKLKRLPFTRVPHVPSFLWSKVGGFTGGLTTYRLANLYIHRNSGQRWLQVSLLCRRSGRSDEPNKRLRSKLGYPFGTHKTQKVVLGALVVPLSFFSKINRPLCYS